MTKRKRGVVGLGLYQNLKQLHAQNPTLTNKELGRVVGINDNYVGYALNSTNINQFMEKIADHRKRVAGYATKQQKQKQELDKINGYHTTRYTKITEVTYPRIKDRIALGHTYNDMGISASTFHRIKSSNTLEEYKDKLKGSVKTVQKKPAAVKVETEGLEFRPKTRTIKTWGWGYKTIKIPMLKRHSYTVVEG